MSSSEQYPEESFIRLKVYGLQAGADGPVRADVFARKLSALINGLRAADRYKNERKVFEYLITKLEYGSAAVSIKEQPMQTEFWQFHSSVEYLQNNLLSVYDSQKFHSGAPKKLAKSMSSLAAGASKNFSHAEISFGDGKVVRIDKYFKNRADRAYKAQFEDAEKADFFTGSAMGNFVGTVKAIDLRGRIASAKLLLDAGAVELDCVFDETLRDEVREALDKRANVSGLALYDGTAGLPGRVEIKNIKIINGDRGLKKWRGRFKNVDIVDEDIW